MIYLLSKINYEIIDENPYLRSDALRINKRKIWKIKEKLNAIMKTKYKKRVKT